MMDDTRRKLVDEMRDLIRRGGSLSVFIDAANELQPPDERDQALVEYARTCLTEEGKLEIDDETIVSRAEGASTGAYILAWVWVYDNDEEFEVR